MKTRFYLMVTALSGLSAVVLGAFGAHALQGYLPGGLLKAWNTAVLYQFVHTLALLATCLLMLQPRAPRSLGWAAVAFMLGILLFSGSLYLLALTQISKLGIITPVGGLCFVLGWLALFIAAWHWRTSPRPPSPSS